MSLDRSHATVLTATNTPACLCAMNRGDEPSTQLPEASAPQQKGSIRENDPSADATSPPPPPAIPATVARVVAMARNTWTSTPVRSSSSCLWHSKHSRWLRPPPLPQQADQRRPRGTATCWARLRSPSRSCSGFTGVQEERRQFRQAPTPADNSPWILISEGASAMTQQQGPRPVPRRPSPSPSAASAIPAPVPVRSYFHHLLTRAPRAAAERPLEHAEGDHVRWRGRWCFFFDRQHVCVGRGCARHW